MADEPYVSYVTRRSRENAAALDGIGAGSAAPSRRSTLPRSVPCARYLGFLLAGVLGFELSTLLHSSASSNIGGDISSSREANSQRASLTTVGARASARWRRPQAPTQQLSPSMPPPISPPAEASSARTWSAPSWSVAGEAKKRGAGLLFFAYGGQNTLGHFLQEAVSAASTFRAHNPKLSIAIVSNNESVSPVFDIHIKPRRDLLFACAASTRFVTVAIRISTAR